LCLPKRAAIRAPPCPGDSLSTRRRTASLCAHRFLTATTVHQGGQVSPALVASRGARLPVLAARTRCGEATGIEQAGYPHPGFPWLRVRHALDAHAALIDDGVLARGTAHSPEGRDRVRPRGERDDGGGGPGLPVLL